MLNGNILEHLKVSV